MSHFKQVCAKKYEFAEHISGAPFKYYRRRRLKCIIKRHEIIKIKSCAKLAAFTRDIQLLLNGVSMF